MRRRLTAAILATVALALVLAGTGTYLLLGRQAVRAGERSLRAEAEGLSGLLAAARQTSAGPAAQRKLVRGLQLEGISVVSIGQRDVLRGDPPEGVAAADLEPEALRSGETLSGRSGALLWAAAPVVQPRGGAVVVVLTRSADRPRPPLGWFLVGGGAALAVAGAVAVALSSSLTRPLRDAHAATARIADGDLGARLPEPPPTADDEVAVLARSINAMAAALEHSRGLERQFLLSVSHDLRTPLTSIRGYAEAIADGTAPVAADAARIIDAEAQRLARLVGDLLDLARLDADAFRIDRRVVPVGEVADEAAEAFRPVAEAAGISLHVAAVGPGTDAEVDPDRLAQVVANLVENGLKFARANLWVDVRAGAGAGVELAVADDGPGIGPADLPRVFERLYVADRPPARAPVGSGLGLAIVADLVAAMGGTVDVGSPALADGTGARFTVRFPAAGAVPPR